MAESSSSVRERFVSQVPSYMDGDAMFADIEAEFDGDEIEVIADQLIRTITAGCSGNEFQNWDTDHLEFIIDMAHDHGFSIPRSLLENLPERLRVLADSESLGLQGCPDEE